MIIRNSSFCDPRTYPLEVTELHRIPVRQHQNISEIIGRHLLLVLLVHVDPFVGNGVDFAAQLLVKKVPGEDLRAQQKRRLHVGLVAHLGTRRDVKAEIIIRQRRAGLGEFADQREFAQRCVSSQREEAVRRVVVEVDGRHALRQDVDDPDGDQHVVQVILVVERAVALRWSRSVFLRLQYEADFINPIDTTSRMLVKASPTFIFLLRKFETVLKATEANLKGRRRQELNIFTEFVFVIFVN